MSFSDFLFRFLPFFLTITFVKGVINFILPIWFIDIYLALALASIIQFKFNFFSIIALFFIGIMRSFDGYYPLLFFSLLYIFLFWLKEVGKKFLKQENIYFPYLFCLISIFIVLFFQLFIYFFRLNLYSITYNFLFWVFMKSLFWLAMTFLFTCLFLKTLRFIIDDHKDK